MGSHTLSADKMTDDQRIAAQISGLIEAAFDELSILDNETTANSLIERAIALGADPMLVSAFNVAVAITFAWKGDCEKAYTQLNRSNERLSQEAYGLLLDSVCREMGLPLTYVPEDSFAASDKDYWQTVGEAVGAVLGADPTATSHNILFAVASILAPKRAPRGGRKQVNATA